ncbi:MAG: Gfo/Idh/MocA family oxidoreductase, partial [SAR324 cluster bacterium]|nr:Gfo/Idh/MocA family oxidoreductase [SAR324 cluster bacterium]
MALARIGVVGAGWWACEFHIPHLLKNSHADLVAVSTLGKEELDKIQQRFEIQVASENHLELYAHDLDGVIVASPHVLHEEHASAAIENGCHVLVEKPMTTDIEGARRLHTLVEGSGKTLMTPYGLNNTHY